MSKTDFKSVREGRHYLRNHLSVVAAFVLIANGSNEEDPKVVTLWDKAEKVVETLQGGEGKTKADQVLALHEAQSLLLDAANDFDGDVKNVLSGLSESAGALAQFANSRDFDSHQKEKAEQRAKQEQEMSAMFAAFLGSDAADLPTEGQVTLGSDENPEDWD